MPKDKPPRTPPWLALLREQDEDELRAGLCRLVDAWQRASQRPPMYFPATTHVFATANADSRIGSARGKWEGGASDDAAGERDYAPGYARLATRGLDLFDANDPAHAAFVDAAAFISAVLDPERRILLSPGEGEPRRRAGTAGGGGI